MVSIYHLTLSKYQEEIELQLPLDVVQEKDV